MMTFTTVTPQDTEALGTKLGKLLFPGAFIAIYGDLGAGKTAFSRGIALALDIDDIASPTFTIVREHSGRIDLFHFDAYRLSCGDELYDIGFDDYLRRNGVVLMEWANNVADALPPNRLDITISGSGEDERNIIICPKGLDYEIITSKLEV